MSLCICILYCDFLIIFFLFFFFFNDTATTEIYTLSLHDALPISGSGGRPAVRSQGRGGRQAGGHAVCDDVLLLPQDRKSTRLNSSHANISYAVFCLKKKKNKNIIQYDNQIQINL